MMTLTDKNHIEMRRVEGSRDKVEEQSKEKAGCLFICFWSPGPLLRYHHEHIYTSKVTSWSILATKSPTFQVINGLLKLGYWSLSELSASLSLYAETDLWVSPCDAAPVIPDWSRPRETLPPSACRWGPWSPPRTCLPSVSTIGWKTVTCVKQESDSMSTHCLCIYTDGCNETKVNRFGCGSGSSLLLPFSLKGGRERLLLPSQPGPPVTSGCWSQFSTLPQAQSICWGFSQGVKVARERKEGREEKEGSKGGQNQKSKQNR